MRFMHGSMPARCRRGDSAAQRPGFITIAAMPAAPRVDRRHLLALLAAGLGGTAGAQAPASKRLLVGVEGTLQASGLAARLAEAIGRDTGLRLDWRAGPSDALLPQLERGELDAALTCAPGLEAELLRQNLIHDRRPIATTDLVLVGPALQRATKQRPAAGDPAGLAGGRDAAEALRRIAAVGARGQALYIACGEASGTRHVERALWQAAGLLPGGAWLRSAAAGPGAALALAREQRAYALVERGLWAAQGAGSGLAVLVEGDPRLALTYHVMRAFRAEHPAGKLLTGWLGGPNGRRVVTAFGHGYRAAG